MVPPVPSLRGREYLAGNGGNSIGGVGASVVPPSPSLGNALVSAGGVGNSLGGDGLGVVPPPPSIGGSGVRGFGTGGIRSFGNVGGSAVPPTPSVGRLTGRGGAGSGGMGSLTGAGEQVVALLRPLLARDWEVVEPAGAAEEIRWLRVWVRKCYPHRVRGGEGQEVEMVAVGMPCLVRVLPVRDRAWDLVA